MALVGWNYRKKLTLLENNGDNLVNYQVKLDVNYGAGVDTGYSVFCSSHCKTDFGDIRFTADDGVTELDYWIEEKTDSDDASIWVEIPAIPASSTVDIYIYYGNAAVSTTGSGADTFPIFDDFDGASLSAVLWSETLNGWTRTVSGSALNLTKDSATGHYILETKAAYDVADTKKRCVFNVTINDLTSTDDYNQLMFELADRNGVKGNQGLVWYKEGSYDRYIHKQKHSEFWAGVGKGAALGNTRLEWRQDPVGDTFRAIASGVVNFDDTRTDATDWDSFTAFIYILKGNYLPNPSISILYVFLAEFVPLEPTISAFGPEEAGLYVNLKAIFEVGQGSRDLYSKLIVQHSAIVDLYSKLIARQSTSITLFSKFEVIITDSAFIYSKFEVLHANAVTLYSKFKVVRSSSNQLKGFFTSRNADAVAVYSKFDVLNADTLDIYSKFEVKNSASNQLKGFFIARHATSQDFKCQLIIIPPNATLLSKVTIRHVSIRWLPASFDCRNPTATIFSKFEAQHSSSEEFDATLTVSHSTSVALYSKADIQHEESEDLTVIFIVRHTTSANLTSIFTVDHIEDLLALFKVRPSLKATMPRTIMDDDIKHWINFVHGMGDAFIDWPTITTDSVDKVTGKNSVKLSSAVAAHKYDAIRFGWVSEKRLSQSEEEEPAPCAPISEFNNLIIEDWNWEDAVYLYPNIPDDTMNRLIWNTNFDEGGWTLADINYGSNVDLRISEYDGYYPGEIPAQYHYNDETAVLKLTLPPVADLPPLTRLAWARLELYRHSGITGGVIKTKRIPECSAIPQSIIYWNPAGIIGGCDPSSGYGGTPYSSTGSQPIDIWTELTAKWITMGRWNLKMGHALPYMGNSGFRATPEGEGISWDNGGYEAFPFTDLLKGWLNGTYENNGLMVEMSTDLGSDYRMNLIQNLGPRFYARENGTNKPRFRLHFWPVDKQSIWSFGSDKMMEINQDTPYAGTGCLKLEEWTKNDYNNNVGGISDLTFVTSRALSQGYVDTMVRFNSQDRTRLVYSIVQATPLITQIIETTPVNNELSVIFRRSSSTSNYNVQFRPGSLTSLIRKGTTTLASFNAGFVVGTWYKVRVMWSVNESGQLKICCYLWDSTDEAWELLNGVTDINNSWPEGGDVRFESYDADLDDTEIWEARI